jgi:putative ABC transport system permease protein
MAMLTVAVGALAAGEIVTLGYLERQVHLATLRALGWPRRSVVQLLVLEAVILGCMGGLIGGLSVAVGGLVIGATLRAIVIGVLLGSLVAVGTTLLAVAGPAFHAYRAAPGEALKGE